MHLNDNKNLHQFHHSNVIDTLKLKTSFSWYEILKIETSMFRNSIEISVRHKLIFPGNTTNAIHRRVFLKALSP